MEQRCTILNLYLTWTLLLGGAAFFLLTERYLLLGTWLAGAVVFEAAYVRVFPRLSRALGYGSVDDEAAGPLQHAPVDVTLYTAVGCPFCPIVEERLQALQPAMGFSLKKIDVTMRPDLLSAKKITGVPVVAVGDLVRTGNLTSQELAEMIGGGPAARG